MDARTRWGNWTSLKEVWSFASLNQFGRDLRFAVQSLQHNPVFAFAAMASLALGIGANTAVFSLIDTLVFRPLQVYAPQELVRIGSLEKNGMTMPLPGPVLNDLRNDPLLKGVCGFTAGDAAVSFRTGSAVVPALSVTGDCFQTLGVRPAIGRLLTPADDRINGPGVAVIGYRFWKDKLGGDRNVLGSSIKISGAPFQILGVTESRFEGLLWGFPMSVSAPISQRTAKTAQDPSGHFYWAETLGRLQNGVAERRLQAQLRTKWRRLLDAALPPGFNGSNRTEIISMSPTVASGATGLDYYFREHFQRALFVVLAISILVLFVSCMNVANLLLARGLQRQREIGIRLAIGAARWHIVRQLFAESAVLLAGGLAAAFVLALMSAKMLAAFFIDAFRRTDMSFTLEIDWRVLLFTALTAVLAVLVFAILPAWRTSDVDPATSLKSASRSVTSSRAGARKALLAGQVAMTFVILVSANVFVQSTSYLRERATSFDGDSVLDIQLMPAPKTETSRQRTGSYLVNLVDAVGSLPGVQRVSLTSFAPLVNVPFKEDVRRLDRPNGKVIRAPAEFVTDGFLDIMHIPLLHGRDFRRDEAESSQRTAIINQSAAERLFPEGHVIGRHIQFGTEPETRDLEIVGIVADRELEDPHEQDRSLMLLNLWQLQWRAEWGNLQVRISGPPVSVIAEVRREIEKAGRQQIFLLSTLSQLREQSLLQDRLLAAIGRVYMGLVLVLAALGLVGLLLFFVSSREKEIAIRIALGAERRNIRWLVARETVVITGTGILIGLPVSYAVVHSCSALVYGISPTLVGPTFSALVVLAAVAGLAILVPMYRASSIAPTALLRQS